MRRAIAAGLIRALSRWWARPLSRYAADGEALHDLERLDPDGGVSLHWDGPGGWWCETACAGVGAGETPAEAAAAAIADGRRKLKRNRWRRARRAAGMACVLAALAAVGGRPAWGQSWHILEIRPDAGLTDAGELRIQDADGSHYGGLKAAAATTASYVWVMPAANPAATRCLEVTAAGVIQYAAAACGTGGGSSFYQTMLDGGAAEFQRAGLNFTSQAFVLTDDAGNNETEVALNTTPANDLFVVGYTRNIATSSPLTGGGNLSADRTLSCPTCVTTNTSQTVTGFKDFQNTVRFTNYDLQYQSINNEFQINAAGGSSIFKLQGSTLRTVFYWDLVGNSTAVDVGLSGLPFGNGWFAGSVNATSGFVGGLVDVSGDVDFGDELRRNGALIINSSGAFVSTGGVNVGSAGIGGGGFNYWNGASFEFGQTVTFNSFPTQMVFKGGVLVSYTP